MRTFRIGCALLVRQDGWEWPRPRSPRTLMAAGGLWWRPVSWPHRYRSRCRGGAGGTLRPILRRADPAWCRWDDRLVAWAFDGMLLPEGVATRVVVGAGEPERLPGRYAVAGLVDAHCHVTVAVDDRGPYVDGSIADRRLDELAAGGVALIRDVGGDRVVTLSLARTPGAGRPQVVAAGRFPAPGGRYFPRMHDPVAAEDLIAAVEREVADGATWVKLIADFPVMDGDVPRPETNGPTYPDDVVAAAIVAAHRAGARVAAHTNDPVVSTLIAAGVDSVEHGGALSEADLQRLGGAGGGRAPPPLDRRGTVARGTHA